MVVISTAHGLKFTDFKVGYHEGTLADVAARHRNPPVELPADARIGASRSMRGRDVKREARSDIASGLTRQSS